MTLNLNPEPTSQKKSKNYKKALRVGGAVSLMGIGSTFAANITLNDNRNVEFGQGLAQTAACDSNGFSVIPVSSYDNSHSAFRVDRVQITGLDLTPVGFGWDDSDLSGAYADQDAAALAHPGQYYDTAADAWKRTCDGVVLDFRAYTDEAQYAPFTRYGYYDVSNPDTSTAVAWGQLNGLRPTSSYEQTLSNPGFAVKMSFPDLDWSGDGSWQTKASDGMYDQQHVYFDDGGYGYNADPSDSYFEFYFDTDWRPNAATISKISVASSSDFPSDYTYDDGYSW